VVSVLHALALAEPRWLRALLPVTRRRASRESYVACRGPLPPRIGLGLVAPHVELCRLAQLREASHALQYRLARVGHALALGDPVCSLLTQEVLGANLK
jgi:hypothetical protein